MLDKLTVRSRASSAMTEYLLSEKLHIERLLRELDAIIHDNVADTVAAAKTDDARYETRLTEAVDKRSTRATGIIEELQRLVAEAQRSQLRTKRSAKPSSAATVDTEWPPRTAATASNLNPSGKLRRLRLAGHEPGGGKHHRAALFPDARRR